MAVFDKIDFWGLKYCLEVRVQHPAFLNHEKSTGSAGGAKNSQNRVFFKVQIKPLLADFGPSCRPGRIFMVQKVSRI